jgi:imidazolonepropionase
MPMVVAHAVYSAHMTPEEALTAATVNAAHSMGLKEVGRLVPGSRADIAVFSLPGAEHLAYRSGVMPPVAVYIEGKLASGKAT